MYKYFYQELFITSAVILLCIILYSIFPTANNFQSIISIVTFFVLIPLLYTKLILKRQLSTYSFKFGETKKGLVYGIFGLICAILILYLVKQYTDFDKNYSVPVSIADNFAFFLFYEIILVGIFLVTYEIFFRGFFMFSIAKKIGYWSVVIQSLLFFMMFIVTNSFDWALVPYFILAPIAGLIAYESKTLLYSFITSFIFILVVDFLATKL